MNANNMANTMICSMCGNVRSLIPVMQDSNETYYFCDECARKAMNLGAQIMIGYKHGISYSRMGSNNNA